MDWGQGTTMVRYLDTVIARMQLGGLAPPQKQRYLDLLRPNPLSEENRCCCVAGPIYIEIQLRSCNQVSGISVGSQEFDFARLAVRSNQARHQDIIRTEGLNRLHGMQNTAEIGYGHSGQVFLFKLVRSHDRICRHGT
jgi:hypothetical protein